MPPRGAASVRGTAAGGHRKSRGPTARPPARRRSPASPARAATASPRADHARPQPPRLGLAGRSVAGPAPRPGAPRADRLARQRPATRPAVAQDVAGATRRQWKTGRQIEIAEPASATVSDQTNALAAVSTSPCGDTGYGSGRPGPAPPRSPRRRPRALPGARPRPGPRAPRRSRGRLHARGVGRPCSGPAETSKNAAAWRRNGRPRPEARSRRFDPTTLRRSSWARSRSRARARPRIDAPTRGHQRDDPSARRRSSSDSRCPRSVGMSPSRTRRS